MQLPPNVEFWLRFSTIAVPAISAIVVAVVSYRLSRRMETHKSVLQTKLYEFQTRFSWIHQRKAEAIEKLFALATRVQNDLYIWARWGNRPRKETKQEFLAITQEHFQNLIDFHDERRIYFDQETQKVVLMFVKVTRFILDSDESIEDNKERVPELSNWLKNNAISLIHETIHPLMNGLEDKFKELLSAEAPSHHLVQTSSPDVGHDKKQQSKPGFWRQIGRLWWRRPKDRSNT